MEPTEKLLQSILDSVLRLDKRIRYAAFVDINGNVVAGGMRKGRKPLMPKNQQQRTMLQQAISGAIFKTREPYFGPYKFSVSFFKNITLAQLPFKEFVLNLSAKPTAPIIPLINKIREMLSNKS